jgi:diaminohydroxyphosphoribosylaminopyrimidine deaminase/5-amino-6-(5-phosphoribosylamino)uracil reductase
VPGVSLPEPGGDPSAAHGAPGVGAEATDADRAWLRAAIDLSRACTPSPTAFCVGALVVAADGTVLADGYSRRDDPHDHAEEAALRALTDDDPRLAGATAYSSLEPCSRRASRPRACTDLILATAIPRVVFAWREPDVFVDCDGAERLRAAGRTVVEVSDLAPEVRAVNAHLLD